MDGPVVRRPGRTVSLLLVLLLTTACTDDGKDPEEPAKSATRETRSAPPLDARIGAVVGQLPQARRRLVVREVAAVVDRWFQGAYLGGDYPRSDFSDAFPGFTRDAARLARADRRSLSNAGIGRRVDTVTVRRRAVRVDVLSPRGYARAATARFRLVFRTDGDLTRLFLVTGRLMLTKDRRGAWRVFAYDVRRSTRPGGRR